MYSVCESIESIKTDSGSFTTPEIEGDFIIKFTNGYKWRNNVSVELEIDCDVENILNVYDTRDTAEQTRTANSFLQAGFIGLYYHKNNEFKKISDNKYEINNIYNNSHVFISVQKPCIINWKFNVKDDKEINYQLFYKIHSLNKINKKIEMLKGKPHKFVEEALREKNTEISKLETLIKLLREEKNNIRSKYENIIYEIESQRDDIIKELQDSINELKCQTSDLEEKLKTKENDAEVMSSKMEKSKEEVITEYNEKILYMEKEKNEAIANLEVKIEKLIEERDLKIAELKKQSEIASTQAKELKELQDRCEQAESLVKFLKEEHKRSKNLITSSKKQDNKKILDLKEKEKKLHAELDESKCKFDSLDKQYNHLSMDYTKLENDFNNMEKTNKDQKIFFEERENKYKKTFEGLKKASIIMVEERTKMIKEIDVLKKTNFSGETDIMIANNNIKVLNKRIETQQNEIRKLNGTVDDLNGLVQNMIDTNELQQQKLLEKDQIIKKQLEEKRELVAEYNNKLIHFEEENKQIKQEEYDINTMIAKNIQEVERECASFYDTLLAM